jgi:hypothetical protein
VSTIVNRCRSKSAAARSSSDLGSHGRIKYPARCLLMELAEAWASDTSWAPPNYFPRNLPA